MQSGLLKALLNVLFKVKSAKRRRYTKHCSLSKVQSAKCKADFNALLKWKKQSSKCKVESAICKVDCRLQIALLNPQQLKYWRVKLLALSGCLATTIDLLPQLLSQLFNYCHNYCQSPTTGKRNPTHLFMAIKTACKK